jgi:hypothetical protein
MTGIQHCTAHEVGVDVGPCGRVAVLVKEVAGYIFGWGIHFCFMFHRNYFSSPASTGEKSHSVL